MCFDAIQCSIPHSNCINVSYVCCRHPHEDIVHSENVNALGDEMYTDVNCLKNVNHINVINEPIELITHNSTSRENDPIEVARADGNDTSIYDTDSVTSCSDLTSSIEINSLADSSIEPSDSEGPWSDVSINASS